MGVDVYYEVVVRMLHSKVLRTEEERKPKLRRRLRLKRKPQRRLRKLLRRPRVLTLCANQGSKHNIVE